MNDLEICKRIAEIEGAKETLYSRIKPKELTAVFDNSTHFNYNPLTDDALCFQLMVKHKVSVFYEYGYAAIVDDDSGEYIGDANLYEAPNKAILLTIIGAQNGR